MVDGMDTALPSEVMKRTHGCRVGMRGRYSLTWSPDPPLIAKRPRTHGPNPGVRDYHDRDVEPSLIPASGSVRVAYLRGRSAGGRSRFDKALALAISSRHISRPALGYPLNGTRRNWPAKEGLWTWRPSVSQDGLYTKRRALSRMRTFQRFKEENGVRAAPSGFLWPDGPLKRNRSRTGR